MKYHAKIRYFCALYLSIALFWYAIGQEVVRQQFVRDLEPFRCEYAAMCATSKPSRAFAARWQSQCTFECRHNPMSCVGVNYLALNNICELFTANPTNFSKTVAGCQYMQMKSDRNVFCYQFGFRPESVVTSLRISSGIQGTALLNEQLFVHMSEFGQVLVYDTTTFQLRRQITLPAAANQGGMAACPVNNCLYISSYFESRVYQVNLSVTNTDSVATWNLPGNIRGISVTRTGNVLVSIGSYKISEYTASGSFVRSLTDSNNIWQPLEVSNGMWAASLYSPVNGIVLKSTNGTDIKTFKWAASLYAMAIDTLGYILAVDLNNNRILVVDPSLSVAIPLALPVNTALISPFTVILDQSRRLLYVSDAGQGPRILVFGGI